MNFRQTGDCKDFKPNNKGTWYFLKKSLKYGLVVENGASCIYNLLLKGGQDDKTNTPADEEVKTMAQSTFSLWNNTVLALREIGSFILHLVTFGIWGALRAAWNIIKLGVAIYDIVFDEIENIPFNIGRLVGRGIKTLKALVVGRRRKR